MFLADLTNDLTSDAPSLPQMEFGTELAKMFLMLFVVLILGAATIWLLRGLIRMRLQRGVGKEQSIKILEKRMISAKSMLYLVEVEGKQILLAESQLEIRHLDTVSKLSDHKSPIH